VAKALDHCHFFSAIWVCLIPGRVPQLGVCSCRVRRLLEEPRHHFLASSTWHGGLDAPY